MKHYITHLSQNYTLGGQNENLDFEMGPKTKAHASCSAQMNGQMFVFGGYNDRLNFGIQNRHKHFM